MNAIWTIKTDQRTYHRRDFLAFAIPSLGFVMAAGKLWSLPGIMFALAGITALHLLSAVLLAALAARRPEFVHVDVANRTLKLVWTTPLPNPATLTFSLDDFHCVRSNLVRQGLPAPSGNHSVELVRKSDGKALTLAEFDTRVTKRSGWQLTGDFVENPLARALRERVASTLGLLDWGYKESWATGKIDVTRPK